MTVLATLPPASRRADTSGEAHVVASLIHALGSPGFAPEALLALNGPLQAASWAVYRLWQGRAPVLHLSASRGVADTTRHCFEAYRDGLYLKDRSFDIVRRGTAQGDAMVLQMSAGDAPTEAHRERIYRQHGLLERLSVVTADSDDSLLAINLYHHDHQGAFTPSERERFVRLAPLLLASVRRHLDLTAPPAAAVVVAPPITPRDTLRAACPALTERELDVCERLLRGWSHDGVAADLGLSVATVKTYRARAFGRLGLHFRSELFARFGAAPTAH